MATKGVPVTIVTVLVIALATGSGALRVMNTYRDPYGNSILNADIDRSSGIIVISSSKNTAKLDAELQLVEMVSSGSNNVVINHDRNTVIMCSSLDGMCNIHSLENISTVLFSNPSQLVFSGFANTLESVFLLTSAENVLLANGYDKNCKKYNEVPVLSSRSTSSLTLTHVSPFSATALYGKDPKRLPPYFTLVYIYGFVHENYAYIVSDHRKPNLSSRIIRICLSDMSFKSYVEIPLDCPVDGSSYTVAHAAHFNENHQELIVSFTKAFEKHETIKSAVCAFNLYEINKEMDKVVKDCYHGNGYYGPRHLTNRYPCIKKVRQSIEVLTH